MFDPTLPDADALVEAVEAAVDAYADEAPEYGDVHVVDVLVVGSAGSDDFRPGDSDLDVCVILGDAPSPGVQLGIDTFLREDWQGRLEAASAMDVDGVDVGVYDADNYTDFIDDERGYSCRHLRWVDIE